MKQHHVISIDQCRVNATALYHVKWLIDVELMLLLYIM